MRLARGHFVPLIFAFAGFVASTAALGATVAHYTFENGADGAAALGKASILDSSGNGLHGTPHGRPKYQAVANPDSTLALRFNGTPANVFVPDSPLLELTKSLTLEAYVYVTRPETGTVGTIVARSDDRLAYDPYYLIVNVLRGGVVEFTIEGLNDASYLEASQLFSPVALPQRQWVHVAGTLDDATGVQALYIDGTLVASTVTTLRPFAALKLQKHPGLVIGGSRDRSQTDGFLRGGIDSVRISDVALEPPQFLRRR